MQSPTPVILRRSAKPSLEGRRTELQVRVASFEALASLGHLGMTGFEICSWTYRDKRRAIGCWCCSRCSALRRRSRCRRRPRMLGELDLPQSSVGSDRVLSSNPRSPRRSRVEDRGSPRMRTIAIALAAVSLLQSAALADDPQLRAEALLTELCARCHAVGRTGASPLPNAPAFRTLRRRLDMEELIERMQEGLISDHGDMPALRIGPRDVRGMRMYLYSIQE
jgi:cytochrome c